MYEFLVFALFMICNLFLNCLDKFRPIILLHRLTQSLCFFRSICRQGKLVEVVEGAITVLVDFFKSIDYTLQSRRILQQIMLGNQRIIHRSK